MDRRSFTSTAAAALGLAAQINSSEKPALLGGTPVRREPFPSWPVVNPTEERALLEVLRSGHWNRGAATDRFEKSYAELTGAKACLATANGTSALLTALNVMEIGPGDEVLVPPYTFIATVNVVLQLHALPVFVDTDAETFQIDAKKIDGAVTPETKIIIPVHLGGSAADLDTIMRVSQSRRIPVLEDACQAHLAEWRGRKVGTYGSMGCFSFQASKNLNSGEGGAIIANDPALTERCYAFSNNSRGRGSAGTDFTYSRRGLNLRLTDFQSALLLAQMSRLEAQSKRRDTNAAALTAMLREIPGITPARMYDGCTRNAWHLYMFRYDSAAFSGLSRQKFLQALRAEGVPASGGYSPLNREPFLQHALQSRRFQRIYGPNRLAEWHERNQCPANDKLCTEAVWFTQTMLLGERKDVTDISAAVQKIHQHAALLAKSS